jgi:hypothetical protein
VRLLRSSAAADAEDAAPGGWFGTLELILPLDLACIPRPAPALFLANLEISGTRWLCSLRLT